MSGFLTLLVEPGFWTSEPVHTALLIGGGAAIVSAIVGVFTVIRGQAFAGHALADISSAGGSASFLIGINPLLGFLGMAVLAAGIMEAFDTPHVRQRDLIIGVVTGAGLGFAALFLYFDVISTSTTGAAVTIMFGSIFAIDPSTIPLALAVCIGTLAATALLYRPLLLCSLSPELAAVQGIKVRLVGLAHLVVLGLTVALSAMTVGAILSTALLIGPAATALRLGRSPGVALAVSALIGLGESWGGTLVAYDSYYWTPGHPWPVSFCVVALIFLVYVAVWLPQWRRRAPAPANKSTAKVA